MEKISWNLRLAFTISVRQALPKIMVPLPLSMPSFASESFCIVG